MVMNKKINQQTPEEETKRRRLVLVPCPFQGHINPMFQLATILHSRGFSITIAHTIFNSPNPSNHPEFTFLPIPDNLSDRGKASFEDAVSAILRVNMDCGAPLRQILAKMDDFFCVIFDEMMYFVDSVAKSLNVPSITLRTNNAAVLVARLTVIKFSEQGRAPVPESRMNETVPELYPLRYKDLRFWGDNSEGAENFWELITNMSQIKASAIIVNTLDCLEHEQLVQLKHHRQVPIFPVGPLHKLVPPTASSSNSLIEEDTSCIEWLDTQESDSVMYVSLGSIASMKETEITEMAWGLINSEQPFLWVIRPGTATAEIHPSLANGKMVKWAPQKEVLAHRAVGAFWSHCGWNSILESLSEGVPMICRPCYADQYVNARYLSEEWKVGLMYENNQLERREVEKIVKKVMKEREGEAMRMKAKELKEKVEGSIAQDGPSTNALNQLVEFIRSFYLSILISTDTG